MRYHNWTASFCCSLAIVYSIVFGWVSVSGQAVAAPKGSRFNADYFTNLPVVTHKGETLRFYDDLIKDKLVVFSFIYLSCNDICPLTSARLAEVITRLGDRVGRDIFFYSITMDPKRDTPELLNAYADAFNAGDGWLFLTGKPEDIKKIRWNLGERSRTLAEHRNHIILGNEQTGEWSRSSIYADIDRVVSVIEQLDSNWQQKPKKPLAHYTEGLQRRVDNQPGQALFIKACASCHTIGRGDRVGPDLKHVTVRRERKWLSQYMIEPDRMRASGDPLTLRISKKYKGVLMPNLGLEKNDVADLLNYIESVSRNDDRQAGKGETARGGDGG